MEDKKSVRSEWQVKLAANQSIPQWGRAAEKLRRLESYRKAKTVFATPHGSLHQARINCIIDGKNLLMPGPGLREGFFLLAARSIAFKDVPAAVTYRGLAKYGHLLKVKSLEQFSVELLLTGALALDQMGGRIGDGQGYFDLCCALLQETACLGDGAYFMAFINDGQISPETLPQDKWDIKMSGAITPSRLLLFEPSGQQPQIYWDMLPRDRIKRIDPLWKLSGR
ncbi:MAG: hypothetical protein JRF02_05980 [Deltaproteobacteria bacterium]|jgi:5-formyltetrahydrofolate cyclo-ligase|nr:hypothetical protein [Deltaproteobacteria bacterium]